MWEMVTLMLINWCFNFCQPVMQELLVECGADKAEDASWLKLVEIHLSHNGLTELSSSLVTY